MLSFSATASERFLGHIIWDSAMQRPRDAAVIEALASLLWARASPYQVVAETSMRSQNRINR
jgi:hypothetical protein